MPSRTKIAIVSAAACLAAAGGYYTIGFGDVETAAGNHPPATEQSIAPQTTPDTSVAAQPQKPNDAVPEAVKKSAETVAVQPVPAQPAKPAPIKPMKEQLDASGPKTEDEKLQQAAEQEYNRF
jgi:hypothetical protein